MKESRIRALEDLILRKKTVSMTEICDHFQISINTARRDVDALVQKGGFKKVYGGI